ncbi:chitinase [Streptacidiphilus sp. P02-A3a]|uniref:chitinase n=1 Tax=Streptacidiphilus sp. P02-A3a TaxID=2704468 RepID=UPI0015FD951A|nr:chitinase [Streptacidiphilus sp. P02-A3a]QMU71139.1 chitinase [Streptacidiphilus sp. P02-A3a]
MRRVTACFLSPAVALLVASGALLLTDGTSAASAPLPASAQRALGSNWYAAAPYVDVNGANPPDLGQVMAATGQKAFDLAYVVAAKRKDCDAVWAGRAHTPVSAVPVGGGVGNLQTTGGALAVSFGGPTGVPLGEACGDAYVTADTEATVLYQLGASALDIDVEGPELADPAAVAAEIGAAQVEQQRNPGMYVSITVPTSPTGVDSDVVSLLRTALGLGFRPNSFTIKPEGAGFTGAASEITALQDFNAQLAGVFGWDPATAYAYEGIDQTVGRTGEGTRLSTADAARVVDFALANRMSRYTFWSVGRDRPCAPASGLTVGSGTCSGVSQTPYQFTGYAATFAQGTSPEPSPSPTWTPSGSASPSAYPSCYPLWNPTASYSAGQGVSEPGEWNWTAAQPNVGDSPSPGSSYWNSVGQCGGPYGQS